MLHSYIVLTLYFHKILPKFAPTVRAEGVIPLSTRKKLRHVMKRYDTLHKSHMLPVFILFSASITFNDISYFDQD